MKGILHYLRKTMYLPIIIIGLLIFAFIVDTPKIIFVGYKNILISPSILTTDYLAVGGLGATLFNVATTLAFNLLILRLLKLRLSGIIFAGIMMIFGYSFYGKNIMNSLPIYLGVYLYSVVNKVKFKNLIIVLLFSTGLSPLVSYTMFGFDMAYYLSIPLGISVGVIAGFILPPLASHTMKFHQGYSVYNVGFALGIISIFFNGIYLAFDLKVNRESLVTTKYNNYLFGIIIAIILLYTILAFVFDKKVLTHFKELFKRSGRLISDFERDFGVEVVVLNTAMILTLEFIMLLIFRVEINGAIFGTMFAVAGFAGAGLHLKNSLFVMIGAVLMVFLTGKDIKQTSVACSVLFSIGLAPVCGRYGIFAGLIAGALHIIVVPIAINFQGGFDLYNNGFASCFVACIMIAVIEALKEQE